MSKNLNTVYVLWLRELKKYYRFKSRIIGSLAMPLFFLVFLGFGLKSISVGQGTNYLQFLVPGVIGMGILFSSVFSGLTVIADRQFGFLKEIMVAPVKRIYIVIGRIAGGMTTSLIQGILILVITILLGFETFGILSFLIALLFMILIAITFISLGLIFAAKMRDTTGFQLVVNFVVFPIFFLSGALSPVDNFPTILKYLTYIDPLTFGVDGMRAALIGSSSFPLLTDLIVIAGFAIVMVLISAYMFEKSEAM